MRVQRKRPGSYHHGDLRRALLDTALQLIEEQGPEAVTTRDLARRLGVSHAAPAHHFPDRDALLTEVAVEAFDAFADALEAAARSEVDPRLRLVTIGRAYVHFALDHPSYLRVMFGRGRPARAGSRGPLGSKSGRAYRVLADAVAALCAAAPGNPEPMDEMAVTCWSMVHGLAVLWIDGPARDTPGGRAGFEALAERIIRRVVSGLIPGVHLPGGNRANH